MRVQEIDLQQNWVFVNPRKPKHPSSLCLFHTNLITLGRAPCS